MAKIVTFMECQGPRNLTHKKKIVNILLQAYVQSEHKELFEKAKCFADQLIKSSNSELKQQMFDQSVPLDTFLKSLPVTTDAQYKGASHQVYLINSLIYILFGNYEGSSYLGPQSKEDTDFTQSRKLDFPKISQDHTDLRDFYQIVQDLDQALDSEDIDKFEQAFKKLIEYKKTHDVTLIVPDRGSEVSIIYRKSDMKPTINWCTVRNQQESLTPNSFGSPDGKEAGGRDVRRQPSQRGAERKSLPKGGFDVDSLRPKLQQMDSLLKRRTASFERQDKSPSYGSDTSNQGWNNRYRQDAPKGRSNVTTWRSVD